MWDFEKYQSNLAILDEFGNRMTYKELKEENERITNAINKRCLVFCLCTNTVGSIAGYTAFIEGKIPPVLLNAHLEKELLNNLLNSYSPSYLWVPSEQVGEFEDMKEVFVSQVDGIMLGRGVAFHIAPSNVPVNYAYSLITGLLTGNTNIVRIPSKDFPQVTIINQAINEVLEDFPEMKAYICLVRYGRDQRINDLFTKLADTRIIWGGDNTITELRKSPLNPRAGEIAFADRYSLAVIDSEKYLELGDKERFAEEFYNDTYLSDQNACTSPRLIVWTGSKKDEAKTVFWRYEHDLVKRKYTFQAIMGINKLTSSYLVAVARDDIKVEPREDNYIMRINVSKVSPELMELKDNSGYFFEYDCDDIFEIREFCNNTHCQTVGYLGNKEDIMPLLASGIKGVDRVVPIGKTMDFDFIWDGYNLVERLTRTIKISI